jgi:hypothetical protein
VSKRERLISSASPSTDIEETGIIKELSVDDITIDTSSYLLLHNLRLLHSFLISLRTDNIDNNKNIIIVILKIKMLILSVRIKIANNS